MEEENNTVCICIRTIKEIEPIVRRETQTETDGERSFVKNWLIQLWGCHIQNLQSTLED